MRYALIALLLIPVCLFGQTNITVTIPQQSIPFPATPLTLQPGAVYLTIPGQRLTVQVPPTIGSQTTVTQYVFPLATNWVVLTQNLTNWWNTTNRYSVTNYQNVTNFYSVTNRYVVTNSFNMTNSFTATNWPSYFPSMSIKVMNVTNFTTITNTP